MKNIFLMSVIFFTFYGNLYSQNIVDKNTIIEKRNGQIQALDTSFLDNLPTYDKSKIKYSELKSETIKNQKLVKECMDLYKINTIEFIKFKEYEPKKNTFDSDLKISIKLINIKKNRFGENYEYENSCQWYGDEYKIKKLEPPMPNLDSNIKN